MKRVGLIINSLSGGGAERVVCTLANHWASSGEAKVFILSLSGEESAFELHPKVQVDSIWKGIDKSGFNAALRSRGAARQIALWRKRNAIDSALSFLQRANFANVLSHDDSASNPAPIAISQRNVATHDYPNNSIDGQIGRFLIKRFYNRASMIVCNSPGVVDSLVEIGVERSLCRVIGNPQNLDQIRQSSEHGESRLWRSNGKLRFIAIGRLIPQKGYDVLLPALGRLARQVDFECLILGRGYKQKELERQREALGLTNHVTFYGWVDNPFRALRESDIFLLPSRWEGFGNVLLEAMALGCPIIAADCPGSPAWLLEQGQSGFLFDNEDSEGLFQALSRLALADELRNEYGHRAAARAEDFSVQAMADQYMQALFPKIGTGESEDTVPGARNPASTAQLPST